MTDVIELELQAIIYWQKALDRLEATWEATSAAQLRQAEEANWNQPPSQTP